MEVKRYAYLTLKREDHANDDGYLYHNYYYYYDSNDDDYGNDDYQSPE